MIAYLLINQLAYKSPIPISQNNLAQDQTEQNMHRIVALCGEMQRSVDFISCSTREAWSRDY